MAKKKNIPDIRFKGFADEWEEKKVIEIAPLQRGFDLPKTKIRFGKYPVVMSNGINGFHSEFKVKAPGVITGRSGTIGNVHYINSDFWPHNTSLWVTDFKGNNALYIYFMYKKLDLSRFGTGSGVPTLNRNDVHDKKINIPNFNEQTKIGNYFKNFDQLITQHQQKYDKLLTIKKAMLNKMFPKNGATVPEIRFKGFSGEWEERELKNEVKFIGTGKSVFVANVEKSDCNLYAVLGSRAVIGYDVEYDYSGDFILTARVGENAGKLYRYSGEVKISDNTVYIQGQNLDYIFYLLTQFNLQKLSFGTGQPLIKASELSGLKLMFAVDNKEQQIIGAYFKNLDNLISLNKQKLEKLKNIKKAFLDKMFV